MSNLQNLREFLENKKKVENDYYLFRFIKQVSN